MMKRTPHRTIKGGVMALLMASVLWFLPTPSQAAEVTRLNITSESVSLGFVGGNRQTLSGNFNQSGQLIMGQFQPTPNIFPPVLLGNHLTFSVFTSSGQPLLNLAPPSGATSGDTVTVDLSSLFAGMSSTLPGWSSWMTPAIFGSVNIGGIATGSFNQATNEFNISWTRTFTGVPNLASATFSLQGIAQVAVAAVPLPAAAILFGSGLIGLIGTLRKTLRLA